MEKIQGQLKISPANCRGCHSCQLACSSAHGKQFSPSESYIRISRDVETTDTAPIIDTLRCDLCGGEPACAEACPYGAIEFNKSTPRITIMRE